ncbi:MAG: Ig-like domain-containing protein [Dermatophilaceae bacterium]
MTGALAACEGGTVEISADPAPSQSAQVADQAEQNTETPTPTPTSTPSQAPVVAFTNPGSDLTVNPGYELGSAVTATDSDGSVAQVTLYVGNREVRSDSAAPYLFGRESTDGATELEGLPVGTHMIKAVATDDSGMRAEDTFTLTVKESAQATTDGGTIDTETDTETGGDAGTTDGPGASNGTPDGDGAATNGPCKLNQAAAGIPQGITLFTVKSKRTDRKNFCTVAQWYKELDNKQVFSLFAGDDFIKANPGQRSHARTEASGGQNFSRADGKWHEFEADMLFNTMPIKGDGSVTLAQIFAGCCGPVLRIEITEDGTLRWASTADGSGEFSQGNQSYVQKPFKVKLRSNGSQVEAYMNGQLRHSGKVRQYPGDDNTMYHFRWGVYANAAPKQTLTNTVTNVRRQ